MTEEITNAGELAQPTSLGELEPKMRLKGTVRRLELYGAFVDVGIGTDALIHVSQISRKPVNRVADVLSLGEEIEAWVDKIDPERGQLTLTMIEPAAVEWNDMQEGQTYTGTVTRLENFGAFVDIGAPKEGLVHISELSHTYVNQPGEVVKVGDEVSVKVLGFSRRKRRIDLSMKALQEAPEGRGGPTAASRDDIQDYEEEAEELPTAMEIALRRALGNDAPELAQVADRRQKRAHGGRNRRSRLRKQQEELLSRTLSGQQDS